MTSSPLLKIFEAQIIPWVEQFGTANIALAQPSWRAWQAANHVPENIYGSPKPLLSKRKPVKGNRYYGNAALVDGHWPADNLHSFRSPNLAFILRGAVAFPLAGYQLHCRPGHGVLVPPGVAQSDGKHLCIDESVPDNTACEILNLCSYNGAIVCWLSHTQKNEHWSYRSPEESCCITSYQAASYLETFSEEMQAQAPRYHSICNSLLNALVNLVWRELSQSAQRLSVSFPQQNWLPPPRMESDPITLAQEYIHNHLGEQLSLNKVARYAYMSRRLFTEQFRQKTGQSFQEYLNLRRFEEASKLLQDTDWSIEVVGGFVGLKPSRLRELFHQRTGLSPNDFRRQSTNACSRRQMP